MQRSVVINTLFCFLLAFAGVLLILSTGLWISVYRTEKNLDENTTTIAIPDLLAVRRYARNLIENGDISDFTTGWGEPLENFKEDFISADDFTSFASGHVFDRLIKEINETIYHSGQFEMDDRRVYGAYVPFLRSVPYSFAGSVEAESYVEGSPQSIASFVVTCSGTEEVFQWNGNELIRALVADFIVEDAVIVHEGRYYTRTVTGYFPYRNPDGTTPVEEGKRYLIVGANYAQGETGPSWYLDIPASKMNNALNMDVLGSSVNTVEAGVFNSMQELEEYNDAIASAVRMRGVTAESFPLSINDRVPVWSQEAAFEGATWFLLEGSLDDALLSSQREQISLALSLAETSCNSLMVLTTNELNSIPRFNQYANRIVEGRGFNSQEIREGSRVCVISDFLAVINGLTVGDTLSMSIYPTILYKTGFDSWIPRAYHPANGLTEPIEYTIVGIYKGLSQDMTELAITPNTVIIPSNSFKGAGEMVAGKLWGQPYDPPILNTIITPNEEIPETKAKIDSLADGWGGLFRFYDQGYSTLKPVLANLRHGMTWIAAVSIACWVIAVVLFSMFYVKRKRNEIELLRCIGVSKRDGYRWVLTQSTVVILAAQIIALTVSVLLFSDLLDTAIKTAVEFTDAYRDLLLSEINIAGGIKVQLQLDKALIGVIMPAVTSTMLMLLNTGALLFRITNRSSLIKRGVE